MKAILQTVVKYAVAFGLLALVVRHVGVERILASLRHISPLNWALALLLASAAQIVMAFRMRYFFAASGVALNLRFAIALYYIGAFYNFLLPGGIGGDAYKVILSRAHLQVPTMQGIRIMLADRASGLCILMLGTLGGAYLLDFSRVIPMAGPLLAAAAVITVIAYALLSQRLVKLPPAVMLRSLSYSLVSQGLWLATLVVIWQSLGDGTHLIEYITLNCAGNITGMFPVSVGGLGIKEMTYYYGVVLIKRFAGISADPELGVTLSLCLFAMMLLSSLPGVVYMEKIKKTKA